MSLPLQSPEDICNVALADIGYKRRIGSLYDGSEASKICLDIYGQTLAQQLRLFEWGFAERNVVLTLLKTAPVGGYTPPTYWTPAYPPLPWIYEYDTPDDMIKLRSLRGSATIIPQFDPSPVNFRIVQDTTYTPNKKVILTNLANAVLVYTGNLTTPVNWEPLFVEGFIAALAKRLAPALSTMDAAKMEAQSEIVETGIAETKLG